MPTDNLKKLFFCNRRCPKDSPATMRLFCFPSACSNIGFFSGYGPLLAPTIELYTLSLPGRSLRKSEQAYEKVDALVGDIVNAISAHFSDKPFCFLGHSFGATLAFHVAKRFEEQDATGPVALFLSSTPAPQSPLRKELLRDGHRLDDPEEALRYLIELGGIKEEMLENRQWLEAVVIKPFISDARLNIQLSTLNPCDVPGVSCPLKFFYGDEDIDHDVQAWSQVSSGPFDSLKLKGGHQYLLEESNCKAIVEQINKDILTDDEGNDRNDPDS